MTRRLVLDDAPEPAARSLSVKNRRGARVALVVCRTRDRRVAHHRRKHSRGRAIGRPNARASRGVCALASPSDFTAANDDVLTTATGRKHNPSNLRLDVLERAVEAANIKLQRHGIAAVGAIGFHSLRRTYSGLRFACGDDVAYASAQICHEGPAIHSPGLHRRDEASRAAVSTRRKAYDRAIEWAHSQAVRAVTTERVRPIGSLRGAWRMSRPAVGGLRTTATAAPPASPTSRWSSGLRSPCRSTAAASAFLPATI